MRLKKLNVTLLLTFLYAISHNVCGLELKSNQTYDKNQIQSSNIINDSDSTIGSKQIISVSKLKELLKSNDHLTGISHLSYDGNILISTDSNTDYFWDLEKGKLIGSKKINSFYYPHLLSPSNQYYIEGFSLSKCINIYSFEGLKLINSYKFPKNTYSIKRLIVTSDDKQILVINSRMENFIEVPYLTIIDLNKCREIKTYQLNGEKMVLSSDNKYLYSFESDYKVHFSLSTDVYLQKTELLTGKIIWKKKTYTDKTNNAILLLKENGLIFTRGQEENHDIVRFWDPLNGSLLWEHNPDKGQIHSIAISKNEDKIVIGNSYEGIKIYKIKSKSAEFEDTIIPPYFEGFEDINFCYNDKFIIYREGNSPDIKFYSLKYKCFFDFIEASIINHFEKEGVLSYEFFYDIGCAHNENDNYYKALDFYTLAYNNLINTNLNNESKELIYKDKIITSAYKLALNKNSISFYQIFNETFTNNQYTKEIEGYIVKLEFEKAVKENTFESYNYFVNNYPVDEYIAKIPKQSLSGRTILLAYESKKQLDRKPPIKKELIKKLKLSSDSLKIFAEEALKQTPSAFDSAATYYAYSAYLLTYIGKLDSISGVSNNLIYKDAGYLYYLAAIQKQKEAIVSSENIMNNAIKNKELYSLSDFAINGKKTNLIELSNMRILGKMSEYYKYSVLNFTKAGLIIHAEWMKQDDKIKLFNYDEIK